MAKRRRYQPLLDVLATLPAEQTQLAFTLDELEAVLGEPLPASAATLTSNYWYGGSVAETNWLACGFTAHINRRMRTITFVRQEA